MNFISYLRVRLSFSIFSTIFFKKKSTCSLSTKIDSVSDWIAFTGKESGIYDVEDLHGEIAMLCAIYNGRVWDIDGNEINSVKKIKRSSQTWISYHVS